MSNELVKVEDLENLPVGKYSDKDWEAAASGGAAFTPRIQLMTSNAGKCKSGDFPINHYAMVKDSQFIDLGKNVDLFVFAWRPKALETGEAVITVYDPSSDDFQRIQEKSGEKNSGCMFGPEFLVWVPSVKGFGTLFMGTKSARREAGNVKARMKQAATMTSKKCKNNSYEWFAPLCNACSTPFEMPTRDALLASVEKFNNPPKSDIEGVKDEDTARAR